MLRLRDLDSDLATISPWLPIAVAAGGLGYAVYLVLLGRTVGKPAVFAESSIAVALNWPRETDRKFFRSEVQLAHTYLELGRSARVARDAAECRSRASEIHISLALWIACHGGDAGFQWELDRLRWLIEAQDTSGSVDF